MNGNQNLSNLKDYLAKIAPSGLCVAFSGGVDSAVILAAAVSCGGVVHAVTMHTPLHSLKEPEAAKKMADDLGAAHKIITIGEIDGDVANNPPDRCYICKTWVFSTIKEYAAENGLAAVLDGTNADDLNEYRPGLKALRELGIKSPLAELGIKKSEVREMAALLGLTVADKPSSPCLATRFPYNTLLVPEMMRKADEMENLVKSLGVRVVRARIHGHTVRLEVLAESFEVVVAHRELLIEKAHELGFYYIALDLEGFRSGSMDIGIKTRNKKNMRLRHGYKGAS